MRLEWLFAPRRWIVLLLTAAAATLPPPPAYASPDSNGNRVMVQFAPNAIHFHSSPEHVKYSWLVGAEYLRSDRWLGGYSYFNNSFGQKCHYLYAGRIWPAGEEQAPHWYFKLTGGAIVGYHEPYEDKIKYNHNGVAPGIIPGVGYQYGRFNAQVNLLGAAGVMITVGYDIVR